MKKVFARSIHRSKKAFKAFYKKSPVLALVMTVTLSVLILGGSAYGIYRLTTQSNQPAESTALDETNSDQQPNDDGSAETDKPKTEEATATVSPPPTCNVTGSLQNLTRYPIVLGGPSGTSVYSSAVIKESSGKPISPLRFSTDSSMSTPKQSLSISGLSIYEGTGSPAGTLNINRSTNQRTVMFEQKDSASSGNKTIYVSDECASKPVAIDVSWSPYPEFVSIEETGHSREVNGDTESYTFGFKITPNAYFGTPELSVELRGYYTDYCNSESTPSIKKTYDGTNTFTLTCNVTRPTCTNPNPDNCKPVFYAHIYAFAVPTGYGDGIPGFKSFTYDFSD